ncbi:MAG: YlxR family protein [Clostridia bacterium]|nr:YlxR family protein [Clostridia bacterium]
MTPKKIPMRKCLGCGEMLPQKELVRVVKTRIKAENEGEEENFTVSLDLVGKKAGRGAYICKKSDCFMKARKARRFEKALSCQIPEEVFNQMESELKENE